MENKQSTSGMLEDLVRSLQQLASGELHSKTALEKLEGQMLSVEDADIVELSAQIRDAEEHLGLVTEQRRSIMRIIAKYAKDLNPEKWCEVKHMAMASYTAFEAYQAYGDNDADLYVLYMSTNDLFIQSVSDWLGLEIPACASCFSDALKGV